MTTVLAVATLWLGLALIASLISIWSRTPTALSEVVVGTFAQLIFGATVGSEVLGPSESWVKFLCTTGAILLTFLAGAELDPRLLKLKWREAASIGVASFLIPFVGCTAVTHYLLGWEVMSSWLSGVALSTTSVAVVYTAMMEFGLTRTQFGQTILTACFITDLASVIALGLIFAPFTLNSLIFATAATAICGTLPWVGPRVFRLLGGKPSEFETKFLIFSLLGAGALAAAADSEAVLPAYIIGMALAGTIGKDHAFIGRLRTLTFTLLTPFYFIRAGYLVSIPAIIAAPAAFIFLLSAKTTTKIVSIYPVTRYFGSPHNDAIYTTLLLSTGLTFGTIASLFGLSQGIIDKSQYSALVAAIIGTAVIPTIIASIFFVPRHLVLQMGVGMVLSPQGSGETVRPIPVYGKILHANDGSEIAFRALTQAIAIAKQNGSELHMVSLQKPGYAPQLVEETKPENGTPTRRFGGVLQRASKMAKESGVTLHTHVVTGPPVQSIAHLAAELSVELLVIGETGHPPWYERLVRSRANRIRQLAQCPVLLVK
jgi:glutathione-regulated potassium-efflux system ancillary protein KefC